jgi:hypothetical protein
MFFHRGKWHKIFNGNKLLEAFSLKDFPSQTAANAASSFQELVLDDIARVISFRIKELSDKNIKLL